jgi:hypothetical protein
VSRPLPTPGCALATRGANPVADWTAVLFPMKMTTADRYAQAQRIVLAAWQLAMHASWFAARHSLAPRPPSSLVRLDARALHAVSSTSCLRCSCAPPAWAIRKQMTSPSWRNKPRKGGHDGTGCVYGPDRSQAA